MLHVLLFHRSCQLRCLTVVKCDYYDSKDLIMGLKRLPHLEELHIMMKQMLISEDFETIGIACPMLKLFSYHNCVVQVDDTMFA